MWHLTTMHRCTLPAVSFNLHQFLGFDESTTTVTTPCRGIHRKVTDALCTYWPSCKRMRVIPQSPQHAHLMLQADKNLKNATPTFHSSFCIDYGLRQRWGFRQLRTYTSTRYMFLLPVEHQQQTLVFTILVGGLVVVVLGEHGILSCPWGFTNEVSWRRDIHLRTPSIHCIVSMQPSRTSWMKYNFKSASIWGVAIEVNLNLTFRFK